MNDECDYDDYDPDEGTTLIEDSAAPPLWHRYAVLVDPANNHDKYYEVRIDLEDDGSFTFTKRWGRRPDRYTAGGNTRRRNHGGAHGMHVAQMEANATFAEKLSEGYVETPRPAVW